MTSANRAQNPLHCPTDKLNSDNRTNVVIKNIYLVGWTMECILPTKPKSLLLLGAPCAYSTNNNIMKNYATDQINVGMANESIIVAYN